MRNQKHNYEVIQLKRGFKVVPKQENRPPVRAELTNQGFWIVTMGDDIFWKDVLISSYSMYRLLEVVVNLLYETWESPRKSTSEAQKMVITNWAKGETRKTLAKKVKEACENARLSLDPKIDILHKKLYSVSNGSGPYWQRVDFILKNKNKYKYLIDDLINYHAARIVLLHVHQEYWKVDWMLAYAQGNVKYTSLTKTLMNLAYGGIPYYILLYLKDIRLPEPALSPIRLWAYLYLAHCVPKNKIEEIFPIILKSSDIDIKDAIRYMWKYFPTPKSGDFRRNSGIRQALSMIYDYPFEIGNWNMIGLAKRSVKYHNDLANGIVRREQGNIFRTTEFYPKDTKTSLPPVSLPNADGVYFLDTYDDILNEGAQMSHCVASPRYVNGAIEGNCYLFHIVHNNEMATAEINPIGFVNQIWGPRNTVNEATIYGDKILREWAKKLQTNPVPIIRHGYPTTTNFVTEEIPF